MVQAKIGVDVSKQVLVIHALGGCDTTSALHGRSKSTVYTKLTSSTEARQSIEVLCEGSSEVDQVTKAGCKLLVTIYGGNSSDTLNGLIHRKYSSMVSHTKAVPEKLPPTERAACFHCLRVHLQVIQWKLLKTTCLDPSKWGWQLVCGKYEPIPTDIEPGPPELLKVIRCQCKPSARSHCNTSKCTCRNNGLTCIAACGHCHGNDCLNVAASVAYDSDGDNDRNDNMTDDRVLYLSNDFDYAEEVYAEEVEVESVQEC